MVTLKELEKQRIKKIRSLNEDEINNYADFLIDEMRDILELNNIDSVEKAENEFADLLNKINELSDLTGYNFSSKVNLSHKAVLSLQLTKYIIKDNESRNDILLFAVYILLIAYFDFDKYSQMLYQLLVDFKKLSVVAPDIADNMKATYVESLKMSIMESKMILLKYYDLLNINFYSNEKIENLLHECKVYIKKINESTDESDELLVKYGFNSIYSGFIDVYENHSKIKNHYMEIKPLIEYIVANPSNVFKKYSINNYDPDSNVSFDEYMKSQPKFNIDSGELVEP